MSFLTLYCCYTQHSSYITVIIINSILSVTGSGRHEMSSVELIIIIFQRCYYYGCEVWCTKQTESYKLKVIWNNVYRKIFCSTIAILYCKSMSISLL